MRSCKVFNAILQLRLIELLNYITIKLLMNIFCKPLYWVLIPIIFIGCSTSKEVTTKSPLEQQISELPTALETPSLRWHHFTADSAYTKGISSDKAYKKILSDKSPKKTVVVAIIDSGVDIEHEDLSANIWVNEDEVAGDRIDNDGNGYVDDIHGWNFIGGPEGSHVNEDTYEATRLYAKLSKVFSDGDSLNLSGEKAEQFELFKEIRTKVKNERTKAIQNASQMEQIRIALNNAKSYLSISSIDSVKSEDIEPKSTDSPITQQAKQIISFFVENGLNEQNLEDEYQYYITRRDYHYNPDFDSRLIVGDDYNDLTDRYYGNNDVVGPRNEHGTHVAGIVGAVRNNSLGMDGVAEDVKLMILRTVPDGDERDKDVANSIRYAVENGADIINMSFGKGYSPQKEYVDEAVKFADEQGVLIIHGAGNGSDNVDVTDNFPTKYYEDGGVASNYITVGASSWQSDSSLVATFSNYGQKVDIFAPGVAIYSTYPSDDYESNDGTSMAAPVVSGVAAVIMAYYPELTASEVKTILLESATRFPERVVYKPGSTEGILFSELSSTGGIVNLYNALKLAEARTEGTN